MPSTFSSPVVGSAYFYSRVSGSRQVCRSTGYALLANVQSTTLGVLTGDETEPAIGLLPSAGGSSISTDQLSAASPANGWDDLTLRALYAFVQFSAQRSIAHRSAIQGYLSPIAADILRRSGQLSEQTMRAVAWVTQSMGYTADGRRTYGESSPDAVSFDSSAVFPSYGEVPPQPTTGTGSLDWSCSPIAEGARANDPITTTAVFGVDVGLLLLVLAAGVIGIASATKKDDVRKNPYSNWISGTPQKRKAS